ncbi:MAG: TetR family transcriptional regulator [Deltaproteobacteria bacterium]|nr:TetR family transcriptional regulator [Deltaproteobacteria bacterium]
MNMPPLSPIEPSPAQLKRWQILDATLGVVGDGGVDAVRHRRVAAEAGLPLGSITYYFRSRDELIRAAFEHFLEQNTAFMNALSADFEGGNAEDVVQFIVEMVRQEFEHPARVRAEYELILYASRDEALAEAFGSWERDTTARVAEVLERLGAARPFSAARTLMELVRGFELVRLVRAHGEDELEGRLREVLAAALGPQEDRS